MPSLGQGALAARLARDAVPFDAAFDPAEERTLADALARIIGDRDIVMLGESSHGDGASIRLRGRLVELLHRRFGFDVLAFEADFWSVTRGWDDVSQPEQIRPFAQSNIYDFWGRAPAVDGLWAYVETVFRAGGRLDVCGFDCRLKGAKARSGVVDVLRPVATAVGLPDDALEAFVRGYAALQSAEFDAPPEPAVQEAYFAALARFVSLLRRDDAAPGDAGGQILAELASLDAWARFAWLGHSRDEAMAANLGWLIRHRYPGRKIIVWAHNNHILKDSSVYLDVRDKGPAAQIAAMTDAQKTALSYVGAATSRAFPDRVCAIATTLGRGQFSALSHKALDGSEIDFSVIRPVPPQAPDSLEAELLNRGSEAALIDFNSLAHDDFFRSRLLDLSFSAEAPYGRGYDAAIYLRDGDGLA
ncbi:erythromycin esterase family protein [Brevundimonas naejangsanensis]|uniref:erythromycin esterase family protein n=1 Tax=Brevundimonas naejangsanensis TaxID=588932 RepID=UPI003208D1CC